MTKLYLIRHAEAEGNIFRRAHGQYDGHITAKGRRQIAALAERFRNVPIDALYSSDLSRAMETAGAITKYHPLPLNLDPRLREVSMGQWEDVPWGNLSYLYPAQMQAFNDDPDRWSAPDAETFPQLRERMRSAILDIAGRHDGQTVVCVSHGMAIRSLLSLLLGVPSQEIFRVPHGDNTCVALLSVEDGCIHVDDYNDNSHLTGELSTFARQSWWQKPGTVDKNNLRFETLNPYEESELYTKIYADTWRAVHGSTRGFQPHLYLDGACRHYDRFHGSILKAIKDDSVVGMTELDCLRGAEEGYGWISLCYVVESERRHLLGVQLLGHAVSVFRSMDRHGIRLTVFEGNTGAIAFYRELGFTPVGHSDGVLGNLILMEKAL